MRALSGLVSDPTSCNGNPMDLCEQPSAGAGPGQERAQAKAARRAPGDRNVTDEPSAIERSIARSVGSPPACMVRTGAAEVPSAAIWSISNLDVSFGDFPYCILSFRKSGIATVTKIVGKSRIRKRPKIGSATFLSDHSPSRWLLDEPCSAFHVYVGPETVRDYGTQSLGMSSMPRIEDFFAIEDPWLTGYFHLLVSEYETYCSAALRPDGLLLEQTQYSLLRHLVRWHSDRATATRAEIEDRRPVNALRPFLVKRIRDYVDANLGTEITLATLAGLASMSPGHFLRSFRAATGSTPYRYVLERRLEQASRMVRASTAPIAVVARECGFATPNYFTTKFHNHFGVSPMKFRSGGRSAAG